jgi:hypothetical protein
MSGQRGKTMSVNNIGMSSCKHCGSQYRLFSISNRDMQGLCAGWKHRHEWACKSRSSVQRLKWAKKYTNPDATESSITVDLNHAGFTGRRVSDASKIV